MTAGARIAWGRVLLGGLAAGLVMNASEFALHAIALREESARVVAEWERIGLALQQHPLHLPSLMLATLALGVLAVATYAALRPRCGPGPRTALCAGGLVWALSYLYTGVYVWAGIGVVPPALVWVPVVWSLPETLLATLLGAWLYRE